MIKLKRLLKEGDFSGKTFINVDIQPEYESSFSFRIDSWINFLNDNDSSFYKLIFLYNGADTLGMISDDDYKNWLIDHGLNVDILDTSIFYDKGYAFFRNAMDNCIDETVLSTFIRFMWDNKVNDSRDMTREMWAKYLRQYRITDREEVKSLFKLLHESDDMVNIPDLMDFIQRYNNIVLTGGGLNECLKEVEIALKALGKPYNIYNKYTY